MIFLTEHELRELTGYAYSSRQIRWLRMNRWIFELNGQQRPKVARSYFEFRMAGVAAQVRTDVATEVRPNFGAIGKVLARKYGATSSGKS